MNYLAKLLLSIAIVGFLPVVPLTSGEAACKPTEAVSRKDAEDRQDSKSAISGDQTSKIDAAVTAFRSRPSIPGISVAIARDNQIIFRRGYGLADLENQVPATAVTVFRIASVAKSLTAVAAMQLAEKGKLDLDAPVQKYAPSFPTKAFPITTRQLLSHLSGVRGYRSGEGERTYHYESLTDALAVFKDDPLEHEPGTKYAYTTFGYTLLGVVIEGASGMSYSEYLRERVLKPAGMLHTQVDDVYEIIPNRARGYSPKVYGQFNGDWRNPALMDSSYKIPGGGLVSTAEDLARFAIAVQNGLLIKQETFEQMSKNQRTRDGRETGYGYGWYVDGREGREPDGSVWHGGVQQGFTADLWILPRRHLAVVILTNLEGGGRLGLGKLANELADIVLH
ncbi:MAG TPA: serine hydrolase domain-containing protein [Blastocatellia bacterium]|nr:serine hydrolase domain-containing protein [Blastocatellia bacterium]